MIKIHYVVDKQNNLEYQHFIDEKDRHQVSGKFGKDRYGLWVTHPGFRIIVKDGDIDIVSKEEWSMSSTDEAYVEPLDRNKQPKPSVEYPYQK